MDRLIIDVREPSEYADSHVESAINIPLGDLLGDAEKLAGVPKDTKIILYCRTGNRSNLALLNLKARGFTNLVNGINQERIMLGD